MNAAHRGDRTDDDGKRGHGLERLSKATKNGSVPARRTTKGSWVVWIVGYFGFLGQSRDRRGTGLFRILWVRTMVAKVYGLDASTKR